MEFNDEFQTDTKNEIVSENFAKGTNSAHLVRIWELRSIFYKNPKKYFLSYFECLAASRTKIASVQLEGPFE